MMTVIRELTPNVIGNGVVAIYTDAGLRSCTLRPSLTLRERIFEKRYMRVCIKCREATMNTARVTVPDVDFTPGASIPKESNARWNWLYALTRSNTKSQWCEECAGGTGPLDQVAASAPVAPRDRSAPFRGAASSTGA